MSDKAQLPQIGRSEILNISLTHPRCPQFPVCKLYCNIPCSPAGVNP